MYLKYGAGNNIWRNAKVFLNCRFHDREITKSNEARALRQQLNATALKESYEWEKTIHLNKRPKTWLKTCLE